MGLLLDHFITFGSHLDSSKASYYSNITGFIRGDLKFHNITPSFLSNSTANPVWRPFAENFVNGTNTTEVVQRSSTWNWSGSEKVALSVVEKSPVGSNDRSLHLTEEITVVHVCNIYISINGIISDVHTKKGHMELMNKDNAEEIRLDFEGVHFVANGSIYGFAEANG